MATMTIQEFQDGNFVLPNTCKACGRIHKSYKHLVFDYHTFAGFCGDIYECDKPKQRAIDEHLTTYDQVLYKFVEVYGKDSLELVKQAHRKTMPLRMNAYHALALAKIYQKGLYESKASMMQHAFDLLIEYNGIDDVEMVDPPEPKPKKEEPTKNKEEPTDNDDEQDGISIKI